MIKVENISKSFKNNILFKNLSFDINKGKKVCFTADSGNGKSTLLKIILGLESFSGGKITIDGLTLNADNIHQIRSKIAWLPQDLAINFQKGAELIDYLEIEKHIFIYYLDKFELKSKILEEDFQKISGGEKQRVLLASCLSLEKPILILDEPTSALDKNSIKIMIETMWEIKDLTIISASHNNDWVNACTQIVEI